MAPAVTLALWDKVRAGKRGAKEEAVWGIKERVSGVKR